MASRVFGKVEALDRAAAEIAHEVEYYLRHGGPAVARAFLEEFVLIAKRIAEDPRSFPPWPHQPGVRRAKLNRFPFFVGFVVDPKGNEDLPLVVWKEPLDPLRHRDHFRAGGSCARAAEPHGSGFSYFVQVVGFTFEFASIDQIRDCASFFEQRIHPSSRTKVFDPEKGEWQDWHERLPARILKGSKRERVKSALRERLELVVARITKSASATSS